MDLRTPCLISENRRLVEAHNVDAMNENASEKQQTLIGPFGALKRPQYEVGEYLAASSLLIEQRYRLQRLRQHNRYLHGWGVLCGLQVVPAQEPGRPWAVRVCPGYALGCCGEEIEVGSSTVVDIRDYLWNRPADHGRRGGVAYVGIRYTEDSVKPVPATPPACGCEETMYEHSRIKDGFEVNALWVLSGIADRPPFDICERQTAPCLDCGDSRHVFLACITLPASESDPITGSHIDNQSCRRQFAPTTMLQDQLVECCCETQRQGQLTRS